MPPDRPIALHTPVDRPPDDLARLVGAMHAPALLESGPGLGPHARWSVYAAEPRLVFEATGTEWTLRDAHGTRRSGRADPLASLGELIAGLGLARSSTPTIADAPHFRGGLIGFYGYDLAPRLEKLPRRHPADSKIPDIRFGLYDTAVIHDHARGTSTLLAVDFLNEGEPAVRERTTRWRRLLGKHARTPRGSVVRRDATRSSLSGLAYQGAVRRALNYIRAGDVFQVNLSRRVSAIGRYDPLDIYLRLRRVNPAPQAAFLRWDDLAVASASPEIFFSTRGDRIRTRPIKGTRPRGANPAEDDVLVDDLLESEKDRAELTMIVDLERNDLGRICEYGSVRVAEAHAVETFAHVHHLVATVEGSLRPDVGPTDVIAATFPGGSITGAPKIRAMEIIDELEPFRRSLYTGAIGYYSLGGTSAFNIAIRTILIEGERASYQVGGGIVADSSPEGEYAETVAKGRGLQAVLEGAS